MRLFFVFYCLFLVGCELFVKKEKKVILLSPVNEDVVSSENVNFRWRIENITDIDSYTLYIGNTNDKLEPISNKIYDPFFEYSNFMREEIIYWQIHAKTKNGEVIISQIWSIKYIYNAPPSKPVSYNLDTLDSHIQFNWSRSNDVNGDKFEYIFNYVIDGIGKSVITNDTFNKLSICENISKNVRWSIQSKDVFGASSYSDTFNFQMPYSITYNYGGDGFYFGDNLYKIFNLSKNEYLLIGSKSIKRGTYEDKDIWILKLNECGEKLNETFLTNDLLHDELKGAIILDNGDFLLYGYSYDQNLNLTSFMALLTNNLVLKWKNTYGNTSNDVISDVKQDNNGNFICIGYTKDIYDYSDFWLIKINSEGQLISSNTYGGSKEDLGHNILLTENGYILLGHNISKSKSKMDIWLFKTDFNGIILWERQIGNTLYNDAFTLVKKDENSFIISGYLASNNNKEIITQKGEMFVANYDYDGNEIWTKNYQNKYLIIPNEIKIIENNNILICSFTSKNGNDVSSYFLKLDVNGEKISELLDGEKKVSKPYDIIQNPNNKKEFYSVGYSNIKPSNYFNGIFIKFVFPY